MFVVEDDVEEGGVEFGWWCWIGWDGIGGWFGLGVLLEGVVCCVMGNSIVLFGNK